MSSIHVNICFSYFVMTSAITKILNKIHDVDEVNSLLVSAFADINRLCIGERNLLSKYVISHLEENNCEKERLLAFEKVIMNEYGFFSFEMLIEFFEFVVSPSDKVVTGAIYTPEYIRKVIVDHIFHLLNGKNIEELKIADIACGCGGFFLTVCDKILSITNLNCHYIYENILYGCDIAGYCIERSKILLSLKALERGEALDNLVFNLYQGNSLVFNWTSVILGFTGFDAVVGNPPYVTSAKMTDETKELLKSLKVCSSGKADLYIPFFQIAIEQLNNTGVLGYITVSNFYRSLNGKALREYFTENQFNLTIVDFGGEQVFKGCSTYTCLFFADKQQDGKVKFIRTTSRAVDDVRDLHFVEANYECLDSTKGWVIKNRQVDNVLQQIESAGTPIGEVASISNGLATLKNELYVLNVVDETENGFVHEYEGVRYLIERGICRQVVKPSEMNVNQPVVEQIGWIIFPYEINGKHVRCYDEEYMQNHFPHTLHYLQQIREKLDNRDKGQRTYEQWFAYGRSQAINMSGFRLLMPYIADAPTFMLSDIDGLLYYNGFAIVSNDIQQLERLKKILNTDIFWFYVKNISKPYANGYYSMGKRYIRYFGIPDFSEEQLNELDALTKKENIEKFLYTCYFGDDAESKREIITSCI